MKYSALLLGATIVLATGVRAASPPVPDSAKGKAPAKKLHCAVMKEHEIDIKEATAKKAFADYKGNRYFFCCPGCAPDFKKNPEKYAKNDHIPTPKK